MLKWFIKLLTGRVIAEAFDTLRQWLAYKWSKKSIEEAAVAKDRLDGVLKEAKDVQDANAAGDPTRLDADVLQDPNNRWPKTGPGG